MKISTINLLNKFIKEGKIAAVIHIRKILKGLFIILATILLLVLLLLLLFNIPTVQKLIVDNILKSVSRKTDSEISVGSANLRLDGALAFNNVLIRDLQEDTLFYADIVKTDPQVIALIRKKIILDNIYIGNPYLNIYREQEQEGLNYEFLFKAFAVDTSAEPSSWEFIINDIQIENTRLSFYDFYQGTRAAGNIKEIFTRISQLGKNGKSAIDSTLIDSANIRLETNVVSSKTAHQPKTAGTGPTPSAFLLQVNNFYLLNSALSFYDHAKKEAEGLDWAHLNLSGIKANLSNIAIANDYYGGIIQSLAFKERAGFTLTDLKAKIDANLPSLKVNISEIQTPFSKINKALIVKIPDLNALDKEIGEIKFYAELNKAGIARKDIKQFVPELDSLYPLKNSFFVLDGILAGSVNNFKAEKFSVRLDSNNALSISGTIVGLPVPDQVIFDIGLERLESNSTTIKSLLENHPENFNLSAIGSVTVQGTVKGSFSEIKANLNTETNAGNLKIEDLKVNLSEQNYYFVSANGRIITDNIELGRLIRNKEIGSLSGSAFVIADLDEIIFKDGTIKAFNFNNYKYNNISFSGSYADNSISGNLISRDKNLNGTIKLFASLNDSPAYVIETDFNRINLKALNLSSDTITVAGRINAKGHGFDPDTFEAELYAEDLEISTSESQLTVDSLFAAAEYDQGYRKLKAYSEYFSLQAEGNFKLSNVPLAAEHLLGHYYSGIEPEEEVHLGDLEYSLTLNDTSGIIKNLIPAISEIRGLKAEGNWNEDQHIINTGITVENLVINQNPVKNIKIDLKGDPAELLAEASSSTIYLSENIRFYQPRFSGKLANDSLSFNLKFADTGSSSRLNLDGVLAYHRDTFNLTIPEADLVLRGNQWKFAGKPEVHFSNDYLVIKDFILSASPDQSISIVTDNLASEAPNIFAEFKNVRLAEISRLTGLDLTIGGRLNGSARIKNPAKSPGIRATLVTDSLSAKGSYIGTMVINVNKSHEDSLLNFKSAITDIESSFNAKGWVDIQGEVQNLEVNINADQFALKKLEPFLEAVAYKLEGTANADLQISGSLQNPTASGKLALTGENIIGLEATRTEYIIRNETIYFYPDRIPFNRFTIYDIEGHPAYLNGEILLRNQEIIFDLALSAKNFLFLKNKEETLLPFYGTIYAGLDMKLAGPANSIKIDLSASTRNKSDIFMNLLVPEGTFMTPDYIQFVNPNAATGVNEAEADKDYTVAWRSFNIEGAIEVTDDAVFNLIVDPINGDKITARGNGDFRFEFDQENNLNLFGTYAIKEGNYTFTFLELISKNFSIEEGSTISWYGNPDEGIMNVTASYTTKASRIPLIQDQVENLSAEELRATGRELPVTVYLKLSGELEEPEMSFDIEVPESNEGMASSMVAQRINEVENTPEELNKQVLGLIAFNQFMPYEGFGIQGGAGGAGIAAQSVSRLLNRQLNNLTERFGGVDLDVNVKAGDQLNLQSLNFTASKQLSDRITVSAGGDIGGQQMPGMEANTVFLGNYIIYYRLSKGGNIRLKVFSRSQQNLYTDYIQQISGVSVNHHKSFDKFKELF